MARRLRETGERKAETRTGQWQLVAGHSRPLAEALSSDFGVRRLAFLWRQESLVASPEFLKPLRAHLTSEALRVERWRC